MNGYSITGVGDAENVSDYNHVKTAQTLFMEVKWQDIKKGKALHILDHLEDKARKVKWGDERKEHYGLVARKIEDKKELEKQGYIVYDREDFFSH